MLPYGDTVIRPLLLALDPGPIVEIGAYEGDTTAWLAELAEERNTILHVVDPVPMFDVAEYERRFAEHFRFHPKKSHDVLEEIGSAVAVLIDGDHNWYTVHGELTRLERIARSEDRNFPLVILHDMEWPYARRDMYYDPDAIPPEWRRQSAQRGIRWDEPLLDEEDRGLNRSHVNAIEEGGAHNGILTAVEEFIAESTLSLQLRIVSGHNGLGVLVSREVLHAMPAVRQRWDELHSPEFLLHHARRLARDAMSANVAYIESIYRIEQLERELAKAKERSSFNSTPQSA
jgi:hypothetical protein